MPVPVAIVLPSPLQSSCKERPRRTAIHAGIGTYAHVVVAGGLAVEVAGAVLDVAIEHGGLLGARDKGEHGAVIYDILGIALKTWVPRRGGVFLVLVFNQMWNNGGGVGRCPSP